MGKKSYVLIVKLLINSILFIGVFYILNLFELTSPDGKCSSAVRWGSGQSGFYRSIRYIFYPLIDNLSDPFIQVIKLLDGSRDADMLDDMIMDDLRSDHPLEG